MTKLSKEELLMHMQEWKIKVQFWRRSNWTKEDERAKKEIKALIQKPGVTEEHGGLKKLQEEKTEEWIEEKAKEVLNVSHHFYLNPYAKLKDFEDFIRSLVEEIIHVS